MTVTDRLSDAREVGTQHDIVEHVDGAERGAERSERGVENVAELSGVYKSFGVKPLLDGVDLTIKRGEFVALLGASGSGKTTLLRILASLDVANAGKLAVTHNRSVVFQEPRLLPFQKVDKNVLLGVPSRQITMGEVHAALAEVGLNDHAKRWPKNLSGGEAQRVALARALIRSPHLLLLDEPFAALDALTRIKMHELVLGLWQKHRPAILFITHDVDEAILLADRVLVLKEGRLTVDVPLNIARESRVGWAGFAETRTLLLEELGVFGRVQGVTA